MKNLKIIIAVLVLSFSCLFLANDTLLFYPNAIAISTDPVISNEGNFVAFVSIKGRRIIGDNGPESDLYIYNRLEDKLMRCNYDANSGMLLFFVSDDGRYVIFYDPNNTKSIVVYDTYNNRIIPNLFPDVIRKFRHGKSMQNNYSNDGALEVNIYSHIRSDGKLIHQVNLVNHSDHTNTIIDEGSKAVINNDGTAIVYLNNDCQIILFRIKDKKKILISKSIDGKVSNKPCYPIMAISQDGKLICFTTQASNLANNNFWCLSHIYMYDDNTGNIKCISNGTNK